MKDFLGRASYYLAFASAASILFSIAISQILLATALAFLLLSGHPLRFPPVRPPLAAFFLITLASLLSSPDPRAGIPQLRKFFVFAILLVLDTTIESLPQIRKLVYAWSAIALLSAMQSIVQFLHRRHEAASYEFLLDGRITGFASHWMTFGGEEMVVALMLASFLLFAERRPLKMAGWPVLGVLIAAIILGMTRCIFLLGLPAGLIYLLFRRRPVLLLAAIAVAATVAATAPRAIRQRAISTFRPHGEMDSNAHRALCRLVGWQMVKAHPWLGLGPEQVGKQFTRFIPPSVPRPLPRGWYGHLHNIYLQYAAERGVFGLLAILWLIGRAAFDFLRYLRLPKLNPHVKAILHGAIAVIVAVLAEGLFEYNLGDSEVLTMFLSVIACGYAAIRVSPRSQALIALQTSAAIQSLANFRR